MPLRDESPIPSADSDLPGLTIEALRAEVLALRAAIRVHRDGKAQARCWLDDQALYAALPEKTPAQFALPPREEFLRSCTRFWSDRQPVVSYQTDCCPPVSSAGWRPPCRVEPTEADRVINRDLPVAFVGLGAMGRNMARHLAAGGARLALFNRTASAADELAEHGVTVAPNMKTIVSGCETIFTCVTNADALRELFFSDADTVAALRRAALALVDAGKQLTIVDHSTISPREARQLAAEMQINHVQFIDAPVTGGEIGAQKGTLTVMAGGDGAAIQRVVPFLFTFAKKLFHVGETGAGQSAKAINQIVTAINHAALAEGMELCVRLGLPAELVIDILSGGAAGSWAMQVNGPKLLRRDYAPGFRARDQLKDLRFALEEAARVGLKLPVTDLVTGSFEALVERGDGHLGNHALIRLLQGEKKVSGGDSGG